MSIGFLRCLHITYLANGHKIIELYDIAEYYLEDMADFDCLILGIPTWNIGQLQSDWEEAFEELGEIDLTGKLIAIFGLGDQVDYPKTFVDAMFFLGDKVESQGARLVGGWSTDGYSFEQSWAVKEEHFIGLVLDEHNQADLTQKRVEKWVAQLKIEFGLPI